QHVEQAPGPGPVGRSPEQVAALREELLRQLHARQMAEQDAVGVQRTLRLSRRAGGVDDQGGVLGACVAWGERVGGLGELGAEVEMAGTDALDDEDAPEAR